MKHSALKAGGVFMCESPERRHVALYLSLSMSLYEGKRHVSMSPYEDEGKRHVREDLAIIPHLINQDDAVSERVCLCLRSWL